VPIIDRANNSNNKLALTRAQEMASKQEKEQNLAITIRAKNRFELWVSQARLLTLNSYSKGNKKKKRKRPGPRPSGDPYTQCNWTPGLGSLRSVEGNLRQHRPGGKCVENMEICKSFGCIKQKTLLALEDLI